MAMHWTYPMPAVLRGAVNIYTVHDLIPQITPELTPIARARHRAILKGVLSVADHIVTVSETSRRAIIDEFIPASGASVLEICCGGGRVAGAAAFPRRIRPRPCSGGFRRQRQADRTSAADARPGG